MVVEVFYALENDNPDEAFQRASTLVQWAGLPAGGKLQKPWALMETPNSRPLIETANGRGLL